MSNFSDFIGGGGSASYPTIFLSKSQTWVPFQDGNICIHVIGGGGGGASGTDVSYGSGSAAGYCKKNSLAVTTSGSFTVVVGAGGTRGRNSNAGGNGGASYVNGTGLSSNLMAGGGAGGPAGTSTPTPGSASGGDVNNTGGTGGYYRGGGAVGLTGTGETGFRDNANGWAGECDIVGDLWSSTLGQIAGGRRGVSITTSSGGNYSRPSPTSNCNGGPFSGGGRVKIQSNPNPSSLAQGGDGGIGAGGGMGTNPSSAYCNGGSGGPGLVVIQYIP